MTSSGIWQCRKGEGEAKQYALANASKCGVTAAYMAQHDTRAPIDMIEGELGFLKGYAKKMMLSIEEFALAKNIYHATKDTIVQQAPGYAKAMKEYTQASELIMELEKTLSLGTKAQIDTAVRKLTSLMRDNVNTNYGQRMKLARQLEEMGGERFMAGLAGNQMQSLMPRSIQGAVLPTVASGAALSGGATLPSAAAMMAAGSPRIVGETANAIGYTMGKLDKLPKPSYQGIEGILEILYQVQEQQENKRNI